MLTHRSPFVLTLLVAGGAALIVSCAPTSPDPTTGSAGGDTQLAEVDLDPGYPTNDVPLIDGTVYSSQFDESATGSTYPYKRWWVSVYPTTGTPEDAMKLLEAAGFVDDPDNLALIADLDDWWLFADNYSVYLSESTDPVGGVIYDVKFLP